MSGDCYELFRAALKKLVGRCHHLEGHCLRYFISGNIHCRVYLRSSYLVCIALSIQYFRLKALPAHKFEVFSRRLPRLSGGKMLAQLTSAQVGPINIVIVQIIMEKHVYRAEIFRMMLQIEPSMAMEAHKQIKRHCFPYHL